MCGELSLTIIPTACVRVASPYPGLQPVTAGRASGAAGAAAVSARAEGPQRRALEPFRRVLRTARAGGEERERGLGRWGRKRGRKTEGIRLDRGHSSEPLLLLCHSYPATFALHSLTRCPLLLCQSAGRGGWGVRVDVGQLLGQPGPAPHHGGRQHGPRQGRGKAQARTY